MRKFLLALPLSLVFGCGGGGGDSKEAGYEAMQSGDHAGAVAKFDAALSERDSSAADYVEVAVARCQALAHVDPGKSQTEFLALVSKEGEKVTDKDFSSVVSDLVSAGEFEQAIAVMHEGVTKFPESPKMQMIKDKVVERAQQSNNAGALASLKGLGYL